MANRQRVIGENVYLGYMKTLRTVAILGNVLLALWLLYNGVDDGFQATPIQLASYIFLWLLLALNSYLLYRAH